MIPQPDPYAVYVLRCEIPKSVNSIENRARRQLGMTPNWVYAAANSQEKYYVGETGQIWKRLKEHILGEEKAANFTKVFQPVELIEVKWFQSSSVARQKEVATAVEYRRENSEWFVYQQ